MNFDIRDFKKIITVEQLIENIDALRERVVELEAIKNRMEDSSSVVKLKKSDFHLFSVEEEGHMNKRRLMIQCLGGNRDEYPYGFQVGHDRLRHKLEGFLMKDVFDLFEFVRQKLKEKGIEIED